MGFPKLDLRLRHFWTAAGIITALTVILTWPQAIRLQSIHPHEDSLFSMWRLAWFAHAMKTQPLQLFQANLFWPAPDTLAYSDPIPLQGVLAMPLLWAHVPTPVVHGLLIMGSFVFSGCAAYVLARYLTGRFGPAIIAALVFAFAPFRFDHQMHLEMLWSGWIPLAVLALLRTFEENSARWGVTTALLTLMQVLSGIYLGVYLVTVLGVMTIALWSTRSMKVRRALAGLVGGALLSGVILLPYLQPYRRARDVVGERSVEVVQFNSAGPKHYLAATPGNWLYGSYADVLGRHEKRLFAGAIGLTLAVVGVWAPLDRRRIALVVGLGMALYLSIGMNAPGFAALREHIEIFRGLRAPARAGQLALLFIGLLAALGMARLQSWLSAQRSPAARLAPAICAAGLALEYATMPIPLRPAPSRSPASAWLADQPRGVVAALPMPIGADRTHESDVTYQSTFHWQPLVNGHSGNFPASSYRLYRIVETLPSVEGLEALQRAGVQYVIVHEAWYGKSTYLAVTQFFDARSEIITRRATFQDGDGEIAAYEIRR
jgi:MFS family permease